MGFEKHNFQTSSAKRLNKFFWSNFRLAQKASQSADFYLAVHGNDAPFGLPLHDDVATALPRLLKTKPLQCALNLRSRKVRQFRHASVQAR